MRQGSSAIGAGMSEWPFMRASARRGSYDFGRRRLVAVALRLRNHRLRRALRVPFLASRGEPLGDAAAPLLLERRQRGHRLLLVVEIGERVAHHRRGEGGAPAAMLDDRGAGVARLVGRREADEQTMVAHLPGEALV